MPVFFERLQLLIRVKNWTQAKLARETNIAEATISNWKKEPDKVPNPQSLSKIIAATGCRLEWLRDGIGNMAPDLNSTNATGMHIVGNDNRHLTNAGGDIIQGGTAKLTPDELTLISLIREFESPSRIKLMIKKYEKLREELDS